ncbi:hypothetical protein NKK47_33650 [Mesorhizobium sp. M0019]
MTGRRLFGFDRPLSARFALLLAMPTVSGGGFACPKPMGSLFAQPRSPLAHSTPISYRQLSGQPQETSNDRDEVRSGQSPCDGQRSCSGHSGELTRSKRASA